MKVVYCIGPFRAPTHWGVQQNVRIAEQLGLEVARLGAMPIIPHKNTENFDGLLTDEFWLEGTKELLRHSDAAITVKAIGFDYSGSTGSRDEVEEARVQCLPVFHDLLHLKMWLQEN
jgi:hypothetical protein